MTVVPPPRMFAHIKKTHAKKIRLAIRYNGPLGTIVYVDKTLPEAVDEHSRLVASIKHLERCLAGCPHYVHPAPRMARFALKQVVTRFDFTDPKELAREIGRLNGVLVDMLACLDRIKGHTINPLKNIRFLAQYRQTARKRDLGTGWNRSQIDKSAEPAIDPNEENQPDAPHLEPSR